MPPPLKLRGALKKMKTFSPTLSALLLLLCAATACVPPGLFRSPPQDKGGVYLLLAVKADADKLDRSVEQTIQIIQSRCDRLRVHCELERQGGGGANRIRLRVSGTQDVERIKSILLAEGMELRPVVSPPSPAPVQFFRSREEAAPVVREDTELVPYMEGDAPGEFVLVERKPVVTGEDVRSASATRAVTGNDYQVSFTLKPGSAERFGQWTAMSVHRYVAVVLNGQARSVSYIRSPIYDNGQINGHFTKQQAEDVALVLMSGNLPAPVELVEEGAYKT